MRLVEKYLEKAEAFYDIDKIKYNLTDDGFDEKLFMDLFVSATNFDFNNPEQYIELKTKMLDSSIKCGEFDLGDMFGYKAKYVVKKFSSNMEGTFNFDLYFCDENDKRFYLPGVTFSTIGDRAYVYAVQAKTRLYYEKPDIEKKLDRYFRKVNKDVPEELLNISPNALVGFAAFYSYLKDNGINEVVAPNFMPIRYYSKVSKILSSGKGELGTDELLEKWDHDQYNITNRFMDLLVRFNYHFPEVRMDYDNDRQAMLMKFDGKKVRSLDNIVYDFENLVSEASERNQKDLQ